MKKSCSICKIEKDLKEFYRSARAKDSHQSACKGCANTQNVSSMRKNPQKYAKFRQKSTIRATNRFKKWKWGVLFVMRSNQYV